MIPHLKLHAFGGAYLQVIDCAGKMIENERGLCLNVGAIQIDGAVARAVQAALAPLGIEAAIAAAERIETDHDGGAASPLEYRSL